MSMPALSQRTLQHLETIRDLRELFTVSNLAEEFLYIHSGLLHILKEAKKHIIEHFGNVNVELDVAENESGEPYKLFVGIVTPYSVEESNERLNELDDDWTFNHIDELDHIIIDVVY